MKPPTPEKHLTFLRLKYKYSPSGRAPSKAHCSRFCLQYCAKVHLQRKPEFLDELSIRYPSLSTSLSLPMTTPSTLTPLPLHLPLCGLEYIPVSLLRSQRPLFKVQVPVLIVHCASGAPRLLQLCRTSLRVGHGMGKKQGHRRFPGSPRPRSHPRDAPEAGTKARLRLGEVSASRTWTEAGEGGRRAWAAGSVRLRVACCLPPLVCC